MSSQEIWQQDKEMIVDTLQLWMRFLLNPGMAEIIIDDADQTITHTVPQAPDLPTQLRRQRLLVALHSASVEEKADMVGIARQFLEFQATSEEAFSRGDLRLGLGNSA